jgi:3-oxoacyl-[acyl-carrier-protein] synthase II
MAMLFPRTNLGGAPHRVVITGAGIVTALGTGYRANAEGFREGRTGFRPVTRFDVSRQRVKTAAVVDLRAPVPCGRLSTHKLERLDHAGRLLLTAAFEAWEQSGWEAIADLPMVLGTTAGGMALGEEFFLQATRELGHNKGQATRACFYQAQMQARALAEALGCRGPITILSTACAAGANAIGHAWELVRSGRAERVMTGGYEALSQLLFAGFDSLQALSPTVCRPFDAHRDGLALGEGAALLTLETLESARRRDAIILAEIVGYGTTIDLHHLTQPHPEGAAACAAMNLACECARLNPEQIDYINAHGTGTPLNDSAEAHGIRKWGGARCATLPVSSTKASIGHLLGASGAIEAIVCLMALREAFLPPERAFETPDPACTFPVLREPCEAHPLRVLSNSFGFGGVNASLIFQRWEG